MKLLITGHKGFIGTNFVTAALIAGFTVSTFDIQGNETIRPKQLDFSGIDSVIHLGAISSTTETDIQKILDRNLSWSIELFEECASRNINMQFASSASVYGNGYKPMKETDICKPLNYYAMSKYLFEQYVAKRKYTNTVQIFRYFNVYGPNEEHKGAQASPYTQFSKQAIDTGIIKVFEGSELCVRDFVSVETVVDTQLKFLSSTQSGIWNIGSGKTTSFLRLAECIAKKHSASIEIIPFPEHLKTHYQYYTCADISKLSQTLLNI
jgi:ADP-L-glycero-D-manno-heptose 6-epimerase